MLPVTWVLACLLAVWLPTANARLVACSRGYVRVGANCELLHPGLDAFDIRPAHYYYGNRVDREELDCSNPAATMEDCATSCLSEPSCVVFTWIPSHWASVFEYNPCAQAVPSCWLHAAGAVHEETNNYGSLDAQEVITGTPKPVLLAEKESFITH